MERLIKLLDYGQSYWLDNLTRKKIKGGELKKRVNKQGLRGITSNPSIFNKAISQSSDYDSQIKKLVAQNKTVHEIYEALVVKDVQDACDILRPVYDESEGVDGYVSLEVSPYLAHNTEDTMKEARRLFKAVDRPNCFIKIPGTVEGVPAIEEMLYEGLNINVTLLFSIASYEAVANAYIRALERRADEGKDIKRIASVASFFLSRIDVLTDELLSHKIIPENVSNNYPRPEQFFGKAAIASGKIAYQSFKKIFSGNRWERLVEKGAKVQRPLWASTSTKDNFYSDVRYVDNLIGPHTVNTLPDHTIDAFADHGTLEADTVEKDLHEAREIFTGLEKIGVSIDFITDQLVNEGVQKFIDPFDNLIKSLAEKRKEFLGDKVARQTIDYGDLAPDMKSIFDSLNEKQFARRLYAVDPLLWKSEPDVMKAISNRLGWLDVEHFIEKEAELTAFSKEIKKEKYKFVILLGMGGSSLCPEVSRETFGSAPGFPKLYVLDNTDPAAIKEVESQIDPAKTLFIVASKSGTTTETLSFYKYFYERVKEAGVTEPGFNFVATTDPGSPLVEEATAKKFRKIFENPPDVGGRYSALTYFGLVPMALIGINIKTLLHNAKQVKSSCGEFIPTEANPGIELGAFLGLNARRGKDKVTFILSNSVYAFGYWVEQLIAESTGKEGLGILPIESEDLARPDYYSKDRVFVYMHAANDEKQSDEKKLAALEKAGHPVVRIEMKNKLSLGAEYFRWELATATAGALIGVNPFDEPNVSESKKNSRDLLKEWTEKGSFGEGDPIIEEDGISIYGQASGKWFFKEHKKSVKDFITSFTKLAESPDYFSLLAYFLRTPSRHKKLQTLRLKLRNKLNVGTTLGYGPRYLHSTGQLHKGGPNRGVYIIFTANAKDELPIPGSEYGFATLQRAQALGDFRSLNDHGRRVIRIHLGDDIEKGLRTLIDKIK